MADAAATAPVPAGLERRAWLLTIATIVWNVVEAVVAIWSGRNAGSTALVGFGLDSVVEVSSALVVVWFLAGDGRAAAAREDRERRASRLIGLAFFGIAAYVAFDALLTLAGVDAEPEPSTPGVVILVLSLVLMPLLAAAKRRVAHEASSAALHADAQQTQLCFLLSAVVLGGLVANAAFGSWWLDPIAALVVAAIAVREGWQAFAHHEMCRC